MYILHRGLSLEAFPPVYNYACQFCLIIKKTLKCLVYFINMFECLLDPLAQFCAVKISLCSTFPYNKEQ